MSPDVLTALAALAIGVAAALLGWPATRFTLHLAAGRDRARRDRAHREQGAVDGDGTPGSESPGLADIAAPPAGESASGGGSASAVPPDGADQPAPDDTDQQASSGTGQSAPDRVQDVDDDGLLRGGLWIGLLERAFVAGGIALGEPSILAVVVAIKGLGRVPELLKSPSAGERFIIGSLASLGVALGVGVIGRALIG